MKFVYVKIPCTVQHHDPDTQDVTRVESSYLSVRMFMRDGADIGEILECLSKKLEDKLDLVDLGDND